MTLELLPMLNLIMAVSQASGGFFGALVRTTIEENSKLSNTLPALRLLYDTSIRARIPFQLGVLVSIHHSYGTRGTKMVVFSVWMTWARDLLTGFWLLRSDLALVSTSFHDSNVLEVQSAMFEFRPCCIFSTSLKVSCEKAYAAKACSTTQDHATIRTSHALMTSLVTGRWPVAGRGSPRSDIPILELLAEPPITLPRLSQISFVILVG